MPGRYASPTCMVKVGDEVVLMSIPGRFRVVEVADEVLTIENDAGIRKQVLARAVRVMPPRARAF